MYIVWEITGGGAIRPLPESQHNAPMTRQCPTGRGLRKQKPFEKLIEHEHEHNTTCDVCE